MTLPPRPPSPPSGPPYGMNFSRRRLAQPAPPLPAATSITASSMNFMRPQPSSKQKSPGLPGLLLAAAAPRLHSGRLDAHCLTPERTLGGVADPAIDQREQRVVL